MKNNKRADLLEAMIDRMSETIIELKFEIAESNSLLRSSKLISVRNGEETNWDAFRKQLDIILIRQFSLMKKYDIKPK